MEKFAQVAWTAGDVLTKAEELGIDITEEQAGAFLHGNERQIQDDMVERGWDSTEILLVMSFPKEAKPHGD